MTANGRLARVGRCLIVPRSSMNHQQEHRDRFMRSCQKHGTPLGDELYVLDGKVYRITETNVIALGDYFEWCEAQRNKTEC